MKHFLIYTNKLKDQGLAVTNRIVAFLEENGADCKVVIQEKDWKKEAADSLELDEKADMMIVLGGDGTVLEAARETRKQKIPVFGVNLGTLGYLTEVDEGGVTEAIARILEGSYHLESRMMLAGRILAPDAPDGEDMALNDIVISRCGSLQVVDYEIYVNGQFLHEYHADGIIVTTPTGSTGYNLSAGGPLIEPSARLITLTPICPHTLNQRSIILSPEDEIEIRIPAEKPGRTTQVEAAFDGRTVRALKGGDRIVIHKADQSMEFVSLGRRSFLETLHLKMKE